MQSTILTFDQLPAYVLGLGQKLASIEQHLLFSNTNALTDTVEKPCNVSEAAEFTDLEEPTIYKHVKNRTIPFHKQGRKLYFFKSELVAWIKAGKVSTTSENDIEAENTFLAAQGRGSSKQSLSTTSNV